MPLKTWIRTLLWLTLLTVSFGYIEAAVVIYLRELYYPVGFAFPLAPMAPTLLQVELGRELATLAILVALGFLCGRSPGARFAWFLYAFAIWDIFYYVFLKLWLYWPAHWLTWDILFLIPTTWVGPVLAPVILSLTMIAFSLLILVNEELGYAVRFRGLPITLLIGGSLVLILSFVWDYSGFILHYFSLQELFTPALAGRVSAVACSYIPRHYMWWMFAVGEGAVITGIYLTWKWKVPLAV